MACKCGSERIVNVSGKCDDRFSATQVDTQFRIDSGYVPYEIGIGGGDYINFEYCLGCGRIQDWQGPLNDLGSEEE
jgi:hypothetical protein